MSASSGASCSATLVDEGWALTAAHCVSNGPGQGTVLGSWCTLENLYENTSGGVQSECRQASAVHLSPGWLAGTGSSALYDYALIEFDNGNWDPGVGFMPISSTTAATVLSHGDFNRGFQRKLTGCGNNLITNNALTTNDAWNGKHMYRATGTVRSIAGPIATWNTSGAKGMSGGPHYYCPSGSCSTSHFLTGVQTHADQSNCSGTVCTDAWMKGPFGPSLRPWAMAVIP